VRPDVVFVAAGRRIVGERLEGAPDLLVEVVSRSRPERDRLVERDLYERNGVREYWIVERDEPAGVQVLSLEGGAYVAAGWYARGSVLRSRVGPDLEVSADEVLEVGP
jgi:Uma2 family endonuclease